MKTSWLLPVLLTVSLSTAVVLGSYTVTTQTYTVEVQEALVIDSLTTDSLTLYPGETREVQVTITNLADHPLLVEIDASILPVEGILVEEPGVVTVPADGEPHDYAVTLTADTDIVPQSYTLTIEIKRE